MNKAAWCIAFGARLLREASVTSAQQKVAPFCPSLIDERCVSNHISKARQWRRDKMVVTVCA